jgi:hypothetical protein
MIFGSLSSSGNTFSTVISSIRDPTYDRHRRPGPGYTRRIPLRPCAGFRKPNPWQQLAQGTYDPGSGKTLLEALANLDIGGLTLAAVACLFRGHPGSRTFWHVAQTGRFHEEVEVYRDLPPVGVPPVRGTSAALPVDVYSGRAFSPDSFRERTGSDNRLYVKRCWRLRGKCHAA